MSDYYPYGSIRVDEKSNNSSSQEQRKFIGQEFDAQSGLSYLNARYYDSSRGQFLNQDPSHLAIGNPGLVQQITEQSQQVYLADPQQLNSYAYARNNPLRFSDPNGEKLWEASFNLTAGIVGLGGGVRWEPGVGWQIFYSNSIGLGVGSSIKYDPNGTLNRESKRGDVYVSKEFVMAPLVGGFKSTTAKENPWNPFSFKDNPQVGKGWAFGLEAGYTYSTEHEGDIHFTGSKNNFSPSTSVSGGGTYNNQNISPSGRSQSSGGASTGGSQTVTVSGSNIPRSKDPVSFYKDAPVYCWGKCN